MSSESQETSKNADFLAFNSRNSGENQNVRNNYQYRPYNRNWNQQNHNFRRDQFMGGPRNDGNTQFTPPDHSSPVGGYQQRYDRVFRGRHMNQYQNQRHFTPYKKFGGHNQRGGDGHNSKDVPIQQYFHQSMLEDPWSQCHKFNGSAVPDAAIEPTSSENEAFELAADT